MKLLDVDNEYTWSNKDDIFYEKSQLQWLNTSKYYKSIPSLEARDMYAYMEIFGRFESVYPYFTERQGLNSYLMLITKNGKAKFKYENQEFEIDDQTCVFLDCRKWQYYSVEKEQVWDAYHLHINGFIVEKFYNKYIRDGKVYCNINSNSKLSVLVENMFQTQEAYIDNKELFNNLKILEILTEVVLLKEEGRKNIIIPKEMLDIKKYVEENYEDKIDLKFLASKFCMDKYKMEKQFKKIYDTSVIDYLIQIRISTSQQLLRTTNLSLEEISEKVGMNNSSYFCKIFKNRMNITPSQYRKLYTMDYKKE